MSSSHDAPRSELTLRGIALGVAITLVFTAAQIYLGLKIGLTFATSIPAAVISMALLRAFRTATIQENNIVQTIASAAGTLAATIFVLPGLIIIGWWADVPFWTTFFACAIGGILGVMYTIPLRRALVTNSDLPYPEGVAAAEVLKVGSGSREGAAEGRAGLFAVAAGSVASALFAAAVAAKLFAAEIIGFVRLGAGATGIGASSSLALLGAGHLVGLTVGLAMLTGLVIAWGILVPVLTMATPMPDLDAAGHATKVWATQVRFLGAGAIGAAAIWTLGKLIVPVWRGLIGALEAGRARRNGGAALPRVEQDIPIGIVGLVTVILLAPAGWLLASFLAGGPLSEIAIPLVAMGIAYLVFAGLLAAAVCGYMAGLIGSSNSPVSGVAILSILGAALLTGFIGHGMTNGESGTALIAYALFVTAILLAVAVVANDNLQDLKTGQLVDATPWKQQVGLIIGVIAGSAVIPPVLQLLNEAYGFAGAPRLDAISDQPLAAPQATLISTLAKGVIGGDLSWSLLGLGALIGFALVLADIALRRASAKRLSLPPLAVGLAIYLPSAVTLPVVIGATAGWFFERRAARARGAEPAKRLGVLVASGFIVGESLFNVALSGIIVASGTAEPFALSSPPGEMLAMGLAVAAAAAAVAALYAWCRRAAAAIPRD
ncbi:MAG: oligopeptide transporter, OPT family [Alphaproteobacteria bacterium]|nr:oligopeptide transporter, OPT family [Alphaproteobacteria bacterium]